MLASMKEVLNVLDVTNRANKQEVADRNRACVTGEDFKGRRAAPVRDSNSELIDRLVEHLV